MAVKIPPVIYPGVVLDPRRNSLNLIRLLLATFVIVAHCFYTGGFGVGPEPGGENLGSWAVFGFFIISGYLITGSRLSHRLGQYLTHRVARIYPAFLACLVVTVTVIAPWAYIHQHGTWRGYIRTPNQPLHYLVENITLKMYNYNVAGTPANIPYPGVWDGSLWTLYYEFACYLLIGAIFCWAAVRRHSKAVVSVLFVLLVVAYWQIDPIMVLSGQNFDVRYLIKLGASFMGGAVLYVWRRQIRYNLPGVVVCLVVSWVVVWAWPTWGIQAVSPLLGYFLLWLAQVLPCPGVIRRQDISYGVYIYGFWAEQILAILGFQRWGMVLYTVASVLLTIPFAVLSWVIVEQPAMRRVRGQSAYPWIRLRGQRGQDQIGAS
ncbi:MAG: acyltransferase [Propionibacteriaceae bacterium]|jgi:peptidoglycan/LPS O-acetylase OafA/YrhL|nr:acyltransferase [Propionibacteriaceae bacterium]